MLPACEDEKLDAVKPWSYAFPNFSFFQGGVVMQIGEPLRTIVVEPIELPVSRPETEPEAHPEPQTAEPENEPVSA